MKAADQAKPPGVDRKIIYTAQVHLVVSQFEPAEQKLREILKKHQGMIAHSEITGSVGSHRTGKWTLRVPVAEFDAFVLAITSIGEVQKNSLDTKDVTEEFFDLEARLKNKKLEEERLQGHLKNSTAKLEEILAVERELSRVREEIERLEGRRQLLLNLTSLTTVDVVIRELRDYQPPTAPTLGTRIGRTFSQSWQAVQEFGAGLLLFGVALIPWSPLLLLIVAFLFWIGRRLLRKPSAAPPVLLSEPPTTG